MKFNPVIYCLAVLFFVEAAWSCPTGTEAAEEGTTWKDKSLCILDGSKGNYVNDLTLTTDYSYYLRGGVFIGGDNKDNVTLRIQPGVFIAGETGEDFLAITRGSKIHARGTPEQPIVFTTNRSEPKRGSWGGLILNGNAPINCKRPNEQGFCEDEGEGSTGFYGGADAQDSSGILQYVRIEWAGYEITAKKELNGIAFQGVGAGTLVDFIQVHQNADDGVEFFGGTVNVKHIYLTGNKDDALDWSKGWTGKAQFVLIVQSGDKGNHGLEGSNAGSPMEAQPRSYPTLSNVTLVGSKYSTNGGAGVLLKEGTGLKLYNSVIRGFKLGGIDIDDEETFRNGRAYTGDFPGIHISNTVLDNETNFITDKGEEDIRTWVLDSMDMDVLFGLEPVQEMPFGFQKDMSVSVEMEAVIPGDSFFKR